MIDWNEIFDYKDGELYWKIKPAPHIMAGTKAGSLHHSGYIMIIYRKKQYSAHRIIWEMHNWPIPSNKEIDHFDKNRLNNKIDNLRCCGRNQNAQNKSLAKNNISGIIGISWQAQSQKWIANITVKRKRKYLGIFSDLNDAIAARKKAEQELGWNQF